MKLRVNMSIVMCRLECQNGHFFQNQICRFFTLNTIVVQKYASVNIAYTYFSLKTNLAVVHHVKEAYRSAVVICNILLTDMYSGSCSSIFTFRCSSCPLNTKLVSWRPDLCVLTGKFVLSRNRTQISQLAVVYFITVLTCPNTHRTISRIVNHNIFAQIQT